MQQKPSTSKRKAIITVVLFFAVLLVLYSSVHAGLNLHAQHTYASADNGFSKNALGDYSKQADDMNLTFYKAPYLSFRTNLSAGNEDIALIIWISRNGEKKEYGVILQDDKSQRTRQIKVDHTLAPYNKDEQVFLTKHAEDLRKLRQLADREWNLFN